MATRVSCPSCGARVEWSERSPHRPFCSRRCRLLDLGDWLSGSHHIPGPRLDDESVADLQPPGGHPANDEADD